MIEQENPPEGKASIEIVTSDGVCTVFYNDVQHDPDEDPYLEKIGWYYQSQKYDDGPSGPYDHSDAAADGAKMHYGDPEHFPERIIALDMVLTGKSRHVAEHTMRNQAHRAGDPLAFIDGGEYYLSDGGYSRVVGNDEGALFLTSNSRQEVKDAWKMPGAQKLAEEIKAAIVAAVTAAEDDQAPPKL